MPNKDATGYKQFLKDCIVIYEEFIPSLLHRIPLYFAGKQHSKPWRSEYQKIAARVATYPEQRTENYYNRLFRYLHSDIRPGSVRARILFGANYIAQLNRFPWFFDHALSMVTLNCSFAYVDSLLYLHALPRNLVLRRLDVWTHSLSSEKKNPWHSMALENMLLLRSKLDEKDISWIYDKKFRRKVKRLHSWPAADRRRLMLKIRTGNAGSQ